MTLASSIYPLNFLELLETCHERKHRLELIRSANIVSLKITKKGGERKHFSYRVYELIREKLIQTTLLPYSFSSDSFFSFSFCLYGSETRDCQMLVATANSKSGWRANISHAKFISNFFLSFSFFYCIILIYIYISVFLLYFFLPMTSGPNLNKQTNV